MALLDTSGVTVDVCDWCQRDRVLVSEPIMMAVSASRPEVAARITVLAGCDTCAGSSLIVPR